MSEMKIRVLHLSDQEREFDSRVLVWPVEIHRFTAKRPSCQDKELNLFEQLVFDFLRADPLLTPAKLAKEIFVPEDFVQCICRRLEDRGFLDSSFKVVEDLAEEKLEKEERPLPGMAFRELVTGRFLPYVYLNPNRELQTLSLQKGPATFVLKAEISPEPVTIVDIAEAFKAMQSRSRVHLDLPDIKSVRLDINNHECGYIGCVLVFDKFDGEVRIKNPFTNFGSEFESTLESALIQIVKNDSELSKWLLDWRRSLKTEDGEPLTVSKAKYDNYSNLRRYPQLVDALNRNDGGTYEWIYAVIEWALYYSDRRFAGASTEGVFGNFNKVINKEFLGIFGKSIGIPEALIDALDEMSLKHYANGRPDMITALLVSAERAKLNPNHPFNRLLQADKKFVRDILQLKGERDASTHGSSISKEAGEEKINWMKRVVSTLIPDLEFSLTGKVTSSGSRIFDARSDLLEEVGYGQFLNLSLEAQDHLVRARLALNDSKASEDSTILIGHLCAALEAEFRRHIQDITIHGMSDDELFEKIYERFAELEIEPPSVLMQTKGMRFRKALQISDKTTLGACVLAWMLSIDMLSLQAIVSGYSSLFEEMSYLIDLRAHLNEKTELSFSEANRIFKNTCKIVKIINFDNVG